MNYVQRKFYIPEETYTRLTIAAKSLNKTITQVLRDLLEEGLATLQSKNKSMTAKKLLAIAQKAEKEDWGGPRDLAISHNKYFLKSFKTKR